MYMEHLRMGMLGVRKLMASIALDRPEVSGTGNQVPAGGSSFSLKRIWGQE